MLGDHQTQDRIAEELEPFVGLGALVLCTPAAVGQRLFEQQPVREPVAEAVAEDVGSGQVSQEDQPRREWT